MLKKLRAKLKGKDYMPFEQDGETYNLYDLPDGFVIKGDLNISGRGLTKLPDLSKVIVKGDFDCHDNALTTLEGAPQKVSGDFICSDNYLTTLKGAPQIIGKGFYCSRNRLTSLEGAPQKVGGDFYCRHNQLETLIGSPQRVDGDFNCEDNELYTLEGAPLKIDGDFSCLDNELETLAGLPKLRGDKKLTCDIAIGDKYNLNSAYKYVYSDKYEIEYEKLEEYPAFKVEAAKSRIAARKRQQDNETTPREGVNKAGFESFKKKMAKEREE